MGFVYLLTFPNGKVYVGKTEKTVERRLYAHWVQSYFRRYPVGAAIRKCGIDNVCLDVLHETADGEELARLERSEIELRNARNRKHGYNVAFGGNGGDIFSALDGTRQDNIRRQASERGRRRMAIPTERTKSSQPGERNPMFGRRHSEAVRTASRERYEVIRDRILSPEARRKSADARSRHYRENGIYSQAEWLSIRDELLSGAKRADVSRRFGVSPTYIKMLIRGTHWACGEHAENGVIAGRAKRLALYKDAKAAMLAGATIAATMARYGLKQTTAEKISSGKHWSCKE